MGTPGAGGGAERSKARPHPRGNQPAEVRVHKGNGAYRILSAASSLRPREPNHPGRRHAATEDRGTQTPMVTRAQSIATDLLANGLGLAFYAIGYLVLRDIWNVSEPVAAGAAVVFALATPTTILGS